MPRQENKIEPNGSPPFEHSFFKWGSSNPEMVQEAKRLMKHREQEQGEPGKGASSSSQRCPKA